MRLSVADRGSNDPLFDRPFDDAHEWRDDPVRHASFTAASRE